MVYQLVLDLLAVGEDAQPDEEVKDNANQASDIQNDWEGVEETEVLNMNHQEYNPDQCIDGVEDKTRN